MAETGLMGLTDLLLDGEMLLEVAPHRAAEFLDGVLSRLADDEAAQAEVLERSPLALLPE